MNWLDVIGWGGSALLVWSLLQTRILRLRALNLAGCLILIVFNGALQVWPMVGLNVVLAVINVFHLRRLLATRHDEAVYQVIEVGPEDAFVGYQMRVHHRDITRFNPGFRWDPAAPGRSVFLVVRGDELVGIVIIRDTGDGVAQLELDYVTERFRDLTPGEFVFRRSTMLAERGFRQVVSPPGMIGAYYDRIGFRERGGVYVLDLPVADTAG